MSISNFQEKFLHGGCAKFIFGFMAVVFVGSLAYLGQQRGRPDGGSSKGATDVAATVGNVQISSNALDQNIESAIDQQSAQFGGGSQGGFTLPPLFRASVAAEAVNEMIQQAQIVYLARQAGADLGDDAIKKQLSGVIEQQIQTLQNQLVAKGKLKAGATQKEIDDAFKKEVGQTPAQARDNQLSQITAALGDPKRRESVIAIAAQTYLLESYKKKASVTDADVDASFNDYEVKQILFRDEPGKSAAQQASSVAADVRSGKLSFEQAIDQYSKDLPMGGKKPSQATTTISGAMVVWSPDYAPLKGLKAGDVSNVTTAPDGVRLYKVVSVKSNPPKDYASNKAMYRDRLQSQIAGQLLSQDLKKADSSALVSWKYPGYEALYLYAHNLSDTSLRSDMAKRRQAMQGVLDKAKRAIANGGPDAKTAALAQLAAFNTIYGDGNDPKMADERIRVINDFLQTNEDAQLRLELVDLYKAKKDADNAGGSLLMAAQYNNSFDAMGESTFHSIVKKMDELKAVKLMPKTIEDQINKELDRWRRDKADHDKEIADTKRMEDEEHKKAEADDKAEKQKDKTPTPPAKK